MQAFTKRGVSIVLTVSTVLLLASCGQSQKESRISVTAARGPHPAWEGTAACDCQPFIRNNDDLRLAVLSQPAPDIWLEFVESKREGQPPHKPSDAKESMIRVVLPPAAKGILKTFWEEGLQFDYKDVFDKPKTPQESLDRDHAWGGNCATVRQELQKIEIAAPDGARTISDEEADRIVALVRKVSGNIIISVK